MHASKRNCIFLVFITSIFLLRARAIMRLIRTHEHTTVQNYYKYLKYANN